VALLEDNKPKVSIIFRKEKKKNYASSKKKLHMNLGENTTRKDKPHHQKKEKAVSGDLEGCGQTS